MSSNELNCKQPNYSVEVNTDIPHHYRSSNPHTPMPENPVNGGIYGGPSSKKPWMPIAITPTATNLITRNLLSANPPPGAIKQFIGTNRLGNNYTSMPGVVWYNNVHPDNIGPFNMKATEKNEIVERKKAKSNSCWTI